MADSSASGVVQGKIAVSGTVKDKNGEPLIGVSVVEKGTTNGMITDLDGNFGLSVSSPEAVLEFSYVGYNPVSVKVGDRTFFAIEMGESTQNLDEVVVTALGIKREKKMLGYAVQDIKADMKMNKYLSMDSKISLSRTKATNRPQYGKGGEVYQLLYIPRNIPLNDLKTFRSDTQRHIYYVNPTLQELNPYYINYQYSNMDERWRAFGYYTVKIDFTPWLYATGKYSFDYYDTSIEEQNRTNGIDDQSKESYKSMEQRYYEHNIEGMILGHNTFAECFRLGYSLGGNIMYQRTSGLTGYSENMAKEGIWYHNSALGKNTAEQTFTERETRSVFGSLQFAWDEWIALDLTARNDWSSTLPKNNCSYFYPSANLSWVFSDMMRRYDMGLPSWITFGKLRLSAAQDWSARRWDHFYKDRSAEYKTLVNTFYYVDRKAYKNAFYMTRIFYAFLASTMTDTYGEMPFGVYVQGKAAPEKCPYNTQEEVYDMVFRMLTEAADSIQPGQCSFKFADREDKCYNGDEAKWIRFANTLRLALRISNVDPERARQEGVAALNHPGGLMQ